MAWNGDAESFRDFIDTHGLTFPQISDGPGDVFAHFGVPGQPALVVVDANGDAETLLGAVEPADLDAVLNAVVNP